MKKMISKIGTFTIPFVSDRGEGLCKRQTYPTAMSVGGDHSRTKVHRAIPRLNPRTKCLTQDSWSATRHLRRGLSR